MKIENKFFISKNGGEIGNSLVDYVLVNELGEKVILLKEDREENIYNDIYTKGKYLFIPIYKNVGHAVTLKTLQFFERDIWE